MLPQMSLGCRSRHWRAPSAQYSPQVRRHLWPDVLLLPAPLRLEYRSKLLNPRWAQAMAAQGSGGAFEISQRMTAMVGWGATAEFKEDWAWDQVGGWGWRACALCCGAVLLLLAAVVLM